jgi:hypothetical protein
MIQIRKFKYRVEFPGLLLYGQGSGEGICWTWEEKLRYRYELSTKQALNQLTMLNKETGSRVVLLDPQHIYWSDWIDAKIVEEE